MNLATQGISISPQTLHSGDLVRICYNGLLSQSGADQVFIHVGYSDNWHYVQDMPMQKTAQGWQRVFSVEHPGSLEFCFKDSALNWDNNSGENWSQPIQGAMNKQ